MKAKIKTDVALALDKAVIKKAVDGLVQKPGRKTKVAETTASGVPVRKPRKAPRYKIGGKLTPTEMLDAVVGEKRRFPRVRILDELRTRLTTLEHREPIATTTWLEIAELALLGYHRDGGNHGDRVVLQEGIRTRFYNNRKADSLG